MPGTISKGGGAIINVSSVGAFTPAPETAIYSATKAFLIAFSEALQMELEGAGARAQELCPGFTHTGFQDSQSSNMPTALGPLKSCVCRPRM